MVQRLVAREIDEARIPLGGPVDHFNRIVGKGHAVGAPTGHIQTMRDVFPHAGAIERHQLDSHRHTLIELAHRVILELGPKLGLSHEDELQQLLRRFQIGEDADFLEQLRREILRFVDDQNCIRLQRHERLEELVQRVAELGPRRALKTAAPEILDRHHAEVEQQHLQQVVARHERIGHQRAERLPIERLEHTSA